MNLFIWLWLGAIVLFGVAEVFTDSMVSIWFVAGSLAALFACMSGWSLGGLTPEATQALVFAVVSALALALTRPLVRRFMDRPHIPTNSDRVLADRRWTSTTAVAPSMWTAKPGPPAAPTAPSSPPGPR